MLYKEISQQDADLLKEFVFLAIHVSDPTQAPDRSLLDVPQIKKYYSGWGQTADYGIKAIDEDTHEIVGMIWIRQFHDSDPSYGFISNEIPELTMSVKESYRGCGVGTELMKQLIHGIKNTYPAISLSVSLDNRAKHLYENFGFTKYERIGDSLTMCLDLEYWSGI